MEWIPAERGTHLPNPANQDKKDEIKASNITGRNKKILSFLPKHKDSCKEYMRILKRILFKLGSSQFKNLNRVFSTTKVTSF